MKIQTFNILVGSTSCNASCPFCVSKMTPANGMSHRRQKPNWINFHKACLLAKTNLVNTVLITGKGEPLLYPDEITEFLARLKKYDFPLLELQTNALIPGRSFEKHRKRLRTWRSKGLNTIVISVVHYSDAKNKQIYAPNGRYFSLGALVKNLHSVGFSVRLNCILMTGFIDSVEEVMKLAAYCRDNDVEQLTLKPVELPARTENKTVADKALKLLLPRNRELGIQKFLEKNAVRLRTLDFGGVVYDYNGQNVCMTDCLSHKPLSSDLRQLIFFPDGHLRYDWRYRGAILM